jgi:hypothetical protein
VLLVASAALVLMFALAAASLAGADRGVVTNAQALTLPIPPLPTLSLPVPVPTVSLPPLPGPSLPVPPLPPDLLPTPPLPPGLLPSPPLPGLLPTPTPLPTPLPTPCVPLPPPANLCTSDILPSPPPSGGPPGGGGTGAGGAPDASGLGGSALTSGVVLPPVAPLLAADLGRGAGGTGSDNPGPDAYALLLSLGIRGGLSSSPFHVWPWLALAQVLLLLAIGGVAAWRRLAGPAAAS